MDFSRLRLSRRAFGLGLLGLALAPAALADARLRYPLRLAYVRVGKDGLVTIRSEEQSAWALMQRRLGQLVAELSPIQPTSMLGMRAPDLDGGASCALAARKLAADRGFSHVILYATHDGRKTYKAKDTWYSKAFASLRSDYLPYNRATGEAHLLDINGGAPVISVSADAKPKSPFDPFDDQRRPEHETLTLLTQGLERRLQAMAEADLAAEWSSAH